MAAVLQLICQGETLANRHSRFPANDALSEASRLAAQQMQGGIAPGSQIWLAPELAAQQTAQALGAVGQSVPALAEPAYGLWAGMPIKAVITQHGEDFQRWLAGEAAPGGEGVAQLLARTDSWLSGYVADRQPQCAIVSAAVIRAMVIGLLGAPVSAFQLIDIAPLSITTLRGDGKRWHLTSINSVRLAFAEGSL
ncbi:histidine phosphatase family protein [Pantoea cypripedii]|uniref:Phosphoglycerate mutase n=1 Tax=Pantoea cypripedii TaxID=55209 RepID=A0A1X1ELT1_PANCY|nr:histidine phosphatase family protein [Pantoea cypripedii]MBP2200270.1 broad specificity phosphatase PhoE [Pantoea cypripedii]ORM89859.1 phosphoglycerate mutase [Pantoea cypripedii]